jgi:hypothetical protein
MSASSTWEDILLFLFSFLDYGKLRNSIFSSQTTTLPPEEDCIKAGNGKEKMIHLISELYLLKTFCQEGKSV